MKVNCFRTPLWKTKMKWLHLRIAVPFILFSGTARGVGNGSLLPADLIIEDVFKPEISNFKQEGFLKLTDTHCALTPKGLAYHDSIAARLASQDITVSKFEL